MAYWIEIHCDAVMPDGGLARTNAPLCKSYYGDNPSVLTDEVRSMLPVLHNRARELNWKRMRGGWVCFTCQFEGRRA